MAGIKPGDEEYQTGKLVLKTAGYMYALKKIPSVAANEINNAFNNVLIKYYPKYHYHKTGLKYEPIRAETTKSLIEANLNKVSYSKIENALVKQGHNSTEIKKIKEFFIEGTNFKLKPEMINGAESMKKLKINNPNVVKELTKDGSTIEQWKKFTTKKETFIGKGKRTEIHFYKNIINGKTYFGEDYKIKITPSKKAPK